MTDSLLDFFKTHPVWAVLIVILMILPIFGALAHIVLKAFGAHGIDNSPSGPEHPEIKGGGNGLPDDEQGNDEINEKKS